MKFHRISIVGFLFVTVLIIALPLLVFVSQQQQQTQQDAATNSLTIPSGEKMPIGDIPGWHQIFTDDFTTDVSIGAFSGCNIGPAWTCSGLLGTPYYGRWNAYPDGWQGTPTNGTYYPSKSLSVTNSMLDYYLHTETIGGTTYHMIDAPEPKLPGGTGREGGILYGRYDVRARWDKINGYHISFLLWPDSETWPRDGEIDFPEGDFNYTTAISAFMHRQSGTSGGDQDVYSAGVNTTQWHTYTIEWLSTSCSFYVDGNLIGRSTSRIPNTPMHWVLQTGLTGQTPTATDYGHVQIGWVTVYIPSNTAPTPTVALTSNPTPTIIPGNTAFSVTLCPHGIGNCGDNANSSGKGNQNPVHATRTVTLTLRDTNNQQFATKQGSVSYNASTGNFQGTIDMGSLANGSYLVTVNMDGFLTKQFPGLVSVTAGQQITLPSISLVAGDIDNDNQLDIQDYNILLSCFGSKFTVPSCLSQMADIDDDGTVDGVDYNLLLREFSVQKGSQ